MSNDVGERLPDWVRHVMDQVQRLDYGVVQITVHQGDVAQVDVTERHRFPARARRGSKAFDVPTGSAGGE